MGESHGFMPRRDFERRGPSRRIPERPWPIPGGQGGEGNVIQPTKYENLMYDIECFSTMPDAIIISIGGVFFNLDGSIGPSFNLILDLREQERLGRTYDSKTVQFWLKADEEAKKPIFLDSDQKLSMASAAEQFKALIETNTEGMYKHTPWARGKEFDLPILKHWWVRTCQNKIEPWYFRNARCVRDLQQWIPKDLYDSWAMDIEKSHAHLVKHNSEHDAIRQALLVIRCHNWITSMIDAGKKYVDKLSDQPYGSVE